MKRLNKQLLLGIIGIMVFSVSCNKNDHPLEDPVDLLQSGNKIVHYWAMVGLRCQKPGTLLPFQNEIINSVNDAYPPAAFTVAAISFQDFKTPESEKRLKEFCENDNMDIALMAINYLFYVENKQPFIETIKTVYEISGQNYNVKAACMNSLGVLKLIANNYEHEN